jgi:putative FmdB family regulatory protein
MPLYEYECESCGHRFEVIQKFSDPLVEQCPKCGGAVRKLIASPAIQFKGTGWYITDYAKKDSAGAGKTGGSKDSGAAGGTPEKTETSKSDKSGDTPPTPAPSPAKKD